MNIGISMGIRNRPDAAKPLPELYEEFIGDVVHGEELGFDTVWNGEHHFTEDAWAPSQFVVLAALAQRTSRIRLGSYVVVAGLSNPLRLAEDAATVDILSGGRLELGFGVGSSLREYLQFGVPHKDRQGRMFETIDVVRKYFSGERFDHHGTYFDFEDIIGTTLPVQRPHPPIWVGAHGPKGVTRTAREGYHLASPMHQVYDAELAEHGRDPAEHHVVMMRMIHLAATKDQAWDQAEAGLRYVLAFYRDNRVWDREHVGFGGMGANAPSADRDEVPPLGAFRATPGVGFGLPFIVGTPEDAIEAMRPFVGGRFTHFGFQFHHPGMAVEHVRSSMRLFAEEVAPALRELHAGARAGV
jgi:alkanesulfonate monooxygenase SsuD/methylene tetrahydromethanopterin reductase-like flavin-dependent oxidoreductase (luciferase family)